MTEMDAWKSMTKEELEHHFSPSRWSHRSLRPDKVIDTYVENVTLASKAARENLKCTLGVPYGTTESQKLDIFEAKDKPSRAPVFLYVHGGYWQCMSREVSSFVAMPLVKKGISVISIGYDLAPQASMEKMIGQVNDAVDYVCHWAKQEGYKEVYIGGHSAGGHLVAMALAHIAKCTNPDHSVIKGAMPISGVYDLRPLVNTYINDPIKLTEDLAWKNSPFNYMDDIIGVCKRQNIRLKVPVGENDPVEYRKQSQHFCQRLTDAGVSAKLYCIEGEDHFTVNDKMCEEDFVITQELIDLILN